MRSVSRAMVMVQSDGDASGAASEPAPVIHQKSGPQSGPLWVDRSGVRVAVVSRLRAIRTNTRSCSCQASRRSASSLPCLVSSGLRGRSSGAELRKIPFRGRFSIIQVTHLRTDPMKQGVLGRRYVPSTGYPGRSGNAFRVIFGPECPFGGRNTFPFDPDAFRLFR